MTYSYNASHVFFYRESKIVYLASLIGSAKVSFVEESTFFFNISQSLLSLKKKSHGSSFFKHASALIGRIGYVITSITYGFQIKFGPRGKRSRAYYDSNLFFFKLGYSSRVPYFLPLTLIGSAKPKKSSFFGIHSMRHGSLSSGVAKISSFRQIDPYNFDGLMIRNGYFRYSR
jgi:hypothetical protein